MTTTDRAARLLCKLIADGYDAEGYGRVCPVCELSIINGHADDCELVGAYRELVAGPADAEHRAVPAGDAAQCRVPDRIRALLGMLDTELTPAQFVAWIGPNVGHPEVQAFAREVLAPPRPSDATATLDMGEKLAEVETVRRGPDAPCVFCGGPVPDDLSRYQTRPGSFAHLACARAKADA